MEPKWRENKWRQLPWGHPKTVWKYRVVFLWFGGAFGPLLAPFSRPFENLGSLSASLREPFGLPEAVLSAAFGSF